jgi:23S rRNA (uracil1939-C5)-methyltransferase
MLAALVRLIIPRDKTLRLTVTLTMTGLDVAVTGSCKLADKARIAASDFAMTQRLARLTVEGELVVEPGAPTVELSGIQVTLPAGGFLQATLATENAINAQVSAHLKKAKRVADLFAGCGTLTFALARKSAVHAVEMDKASVAALDKARRHATGLKAVSVEVRDLFRRPLMAAELNDYDGVVFDPPRAGAEEQCSHLARSKVKRVVAVSCNPATLARDLRILVDGGYRIKSVTPIDQFLWSPHVEVVTTLER